MIDLTPEQLAEIQQIVKDYHDAFAVHLLGEDSVSPEVLKRLKDLDIFDPEYNAIEDVYKFGRLLAKLEQKSTVSMGYESFKQRMEREPIALTPSEVKGVKFAVQKCGQYVTKLGSQVSASITNSVLEAERSVRVQAIQDATARNIAKRKSVKALISDLRWNQQEWSRDWARVALTEKNNALQQGLADHYREEYGKDSLVAKRPQPDACQHCIKHYLDADGNPKVFKLSDLEVNGTNVGLKQADWKPTVGGLHPHCLPGNAPITTRDGNKRIDEILPGEMVLTHTGEYKPVTHIWESWYSGDCVSVKLFDGRVVSSTSNHPFLTSRGWVLAKDLQNSDRLTSFSSSSDTGMGIDLNSQPRPPMVQQNLFLASILFGFTGRGVPVTAVYFNGEFYIREGQINIEDIKGVIGNGYESRVNQPFVNHAFIGRFKLTDFALCSDTLTFHRLPHAPSSLVSFISERFPLFSRHFLHSNGISSTSSPGNQSSGLDPINDDISGASKMFSDGQYRHQLVEVHVDDFGNVEFNPSFVYSAGQVCTPFENVDIVGVTLAKKEGLVYNLTVADNESYVTNGIVTHNCRCTLVRVPTGWAFNDEGDLVPKTMLDKSSALRKSKYNPVARVSFQGLIIAIESPEGSFRHWQEGDKHGVTYMHNDYGYIVNTQGDDADELDCYLGGNPESDQVFIVDQQNPITGVYDERKVMLGFTTEDEAMVAFDVHKDRIDFAVSVHPMSMDDFKRWLGPSFQPVDPDGLRYVVKSRIPGYIANETSQAHNRSPSPGTSANYHFGTPKKRRDGESHISRHGTGYPPLHQENTPEDELMREVLREIGVRKKEEFIVRDPVARDPQEWFLPEESYAERDSEQIKRTRLWLDDMLVRKTPVNRVPILADQHVKEIQRSPVTDDKKD